MDKRITEFKNGLELTTPKYYIADRINFHKKSNTSDDEVMLVEYVITSVMGIKNNNNGYDGYCYEASFSLGDSQFGVTLSEETIDRMVRREKVLILLPEDSRMDFLLYELQDIKGID
jgi:hypothetical protein